MSKLSRRSASTGSLGIARREAWIVVLAVVLLVAAALVYSARQVKLYSASANVLISTTDLASELTGTQASAAEEEDRLLATQLQLAQGLSIASAALRATGSSESSTEFQRQSTVSEAALSDILTFSVKARTPARAMTLANAWATAFSEFRKRLDTASINQALAADTAQINRLKATGRASDSLVQSLQEKAQQLQTLGTLQTSNAPVVQRAVTARLVQPTPVKTAAFAGVIGLLLGLLIAALRERGSQQLRDPEELEAVLQATCVGRLPTPPRGADGWSVLKDSPFAEGIRLLRTNIEFQLSNTSDKLLMITSAAPRDGKSTTAANLCVALARAGSKVAIVDCDLRRPRLDTLLDVKRSMGVTDVVAGDIDVQRACISVPVADGPRATGHEELLLLTAGSAVTNPADVFTSVAFGRMLQSLSSSVDLVVLDTPPVLGVGDAMALSAHVDKVLVVAKLGSTNRRACSEMVRLLTQTAAEVIGFVTTADDDSTRIGGYSYYTSARKKKSAGIPLRTR